MSHSMAKYGCIASAVIEMKKIVLQEPLSTSQPIIVFFELINDGGNYASEANNPHTPAKVLQMSNHTLSSSRIYRDACKDWLSN